MKGLTMLSFWHANGIFIRQPLKLRPIACCYHRVLISILPCSNLLPSCPVYSLLLWQLVVCHSTHTHTPWLLHWDWEALPSARRWLPVLPCSRPPSTACDATPPARPRCVISISHPEFTSVMHNYIADNVFLVGVVSQGHLRRQAPCRDWEG